MASDDNLTINWQFGSIKNNFHFALARSNFLCDQSFVNVPVARTHSTPIFINLQLCTFLYWQVCHCRQRSPSSFFAQLLSFLLVCDCLQGCAVNPFSVIHFVETCKHMFLQRDAVEVRCSQKEAWWQGFPQIFQQSFDSRCGQTTRCTT